jgi:hypothetical protein
LTLLAVSLVSVFLVNGIVDSQDAPDTAPVPQAQESQAVLVFDEIQVKDGSRILGEVVDMTDGKLKVQTAFGGEVEVAWDDVTSIKTAKPLPFVLQDGSIILGTAEGAAEGRVNIRAGFLAEPSTVGLALITAINPPEKKSVLYTGDINLGTSVNDGNTQTKGFNLVANFVARSDKQRFTVRAGYNYAEDAGQLTERNGNLSLKYDYFITQRFYAFMSTLIESDKFKDLDLRSAVSAGPGYQFIDQDDFSEEWLREMGLSAEFGLSYFNENFAAPVPDDSYVAARWGLDFDWSFVPEQVACFLRQQGYPSLENAKDLYITTVTGLRFVVWGDLIATAQVDWRWDGAPPRGVERSDVLYLLTLGYKFKF